MVCLVSAFVKVDLLMVSHEVIMTHFGDRAGT
jgi:hypothetical protein